MGKETDKKEPEKKEGDKKGGTEAKANASVISAKSGASAGGNAADFRGPEELKLDEWVRKVEKGGPKAILREFEALKKEKKPSDRTDDVFRKNMLKNRYEDVGCWDQTRVKLGGEGEGYIHASWVDGVDAPKKFLLTQGPLEEVYDETGTTKEFEDTCTDFWQMVWEQKVQVLVMLCLLEEQGKSKCSEYWPAAKNERMIFGELAVTCKQTGEKPMDDQIIVITQLSLQKKGVKKAREVAHYLNKTWPDRKCPSKAEPIFDFLGKLDAVQAHLTTKNEVAKGELCPILVHCSAGIGRSGTLVALDVAKTLMKKWGGLDVKHIVRTIRRGRNGAVQTHPQYSCIYVGILHLIQVAKPDLFPATFSLAKFAESLNALLAKL